MAETFPGGAALLEYAYDALGLHEGDLVDVRAGPREGPSADWLTLATRVGAERVFFVQNDPVVVFSALRGEASDLQVLEAYRRTWCLARPRCLFLAVGDELRVYALSQLPERSRADKLQPLEVVERAADVAEALADFRRERLESGVAFEEAAFQTPRSRADARLLHDVRSAESALMRAGLSRRGAHALIERAILVRYLEDRDVLTPAYFEKVAARHPEWLAELAAFEAPLVGPSSRFVTCLGDRDLTAALFQRLGHDFNGDLFVDRDGELAELTEHQLKVLRDLLSGADLDGQGQLFLWAYDFSIVPTSLISSMYELFYRREAERKTSTYYTPRSLVEVVLSSILTDEVLERRPTVCDPACGSGVFLVEAFRRIVRFETSRHGGRISSEQLRRILLERVRGVDIDESAVRLAAFSLYLAFLDMQSPPDILEAAPLPPLIGDAETDAARPLRVADAFADGVLPDNTFDVVVANPPWTEPQLGAAMPAAAREWARERSLPYGDNNPSQLFLWRALRLLSDEGRAALLIGAGTLLNARSTSKDFRRLFLAEAKLEQVIALWPVRGDFFVGARAPFAYIRFAPAPEGGGGDEPIVFDTARRGGPRDGSLTFVPVKRRLVRPSQLVQHDFLWKTMSEGGRRDAELVLRLRQEETKLVDLIDEAHPPRYGWQRAHRREAGVEPDQDLRDMLSVNKLESWGPLRDDWIVALPERATRIPHRAAFDGRRLLVDMGITSDERLHARVVDGKLAFDHNIWALPLQHRPEWEADVVLGVLLSSTGRYYLSMTAGLWGVWRDQMRKEQLVQLPLRLPSADDAAVSRIREAVAQLPAAGATGASLFDQSSVGAHSLIADIDDAVFNLFGLADFERDLVEDHWRERDAQRNPGPGLTARPDAESHEALRHYASVFLDAWRPLIGDRLDLKWRVHRDPSTRSLAVVFGLHEVGAEPDDISGKAAWTQTLRRLAGAIDKPAAGLRSFGMVRAVTDSDIVLIKRDRPELWTASAARDDAEATSVQLTVARRG
jgi:N-6 DNA Methylase